MSGKLSIFPTLMALGTLTIFALASNRAESRPVTVAAQGSAPHVFGTIALPLKKTRFDDRWLRILRNEAVVGQLASLMQAARRSAQIEQLRLVNASLNKRIRYRHDTHPSEDYWSTAGETLGQSAGDCEDYAIAKLQALKALGVAESDLFMTIGYDGQAGAVHAVLVARARPIFRPR